MRELVYEELLQSLLANRIDDFARQTGGIDFRTLEVFVPIGHVADQPALHIFLPERRPAIDTEAIEPERVQWQFRRELERRLHVCDGFAGIAYRKEAVDDFNPRLLGVLDGHGHFLQRLLFLEPIQNLLTAAFDSEHDRPAMRLRHDRK